MKTASLLFALLGILALSPSLHAQASDAIAKSQQEAMRLYPDLGVKNSVFNKTFLRRVETLRAAHDPIFWQADGRSWWQRLSPKNSPPRMSRGSK